MTETLPDRSSMPALVGLCPLHTAEFYMPLEPGEGVVCPEPACGRTMVVYEPAALRATLDEEER